MKLPIREMKLGDSQYNRADGAWKATTLYDFAKAKDYPIVDMPLWCVDLSTNAFDCDSLKEFIFQCKRVDKCSLDYPIILDDHGVIADGYHRVCKAILEGRETIKAIRLLEMPAPDYVRVDNNE